MENIKKSVISGEFIIEIDKTGHVSVYRIYDNVIKSLREVYEKENLEYDPNWNTRQMGNDLIKKYCTDGNNTQAIIGDYLIQRRENGSIETFRDYGKGSVKKALEEVAQKVGLKVESGWNTQLLGNKLVDFINNKPQNIYIMQELKLNGRMTVTAMKDLFKTLTGGTLRVKDGNRKADESATLASIRKDSDNKSGVLELNPEMTVGDFKSKMLSDFGLKVEVGTPDDWVSVPDGITLGQLRGLPKNAVKAQLEALVVSEEKAATEVSDEILKAAKMYQSYPILVIKLGEIKFPLTSELVSKHLDAGDSGAYGAVMLYDEDMSLLKIFSGYDFDDALYEAVDAKEELEGEGEEVAYVYYTQYFTFLNLKSSLNLYSPEVADTLGAAIAANAGNYDTGYYTDKDIIVRLINSDGKIWADYFVENSAFNEDIDPEVMDYLIANSSGENDAEEYKKVLSLGNGDIGSKSEGATKWGVIDLAGNMIIGSKFDDIDTFVDGLCYVKIDDKYGFIDKTGKFVIEPKFDDVNYFKDGLCKVKLDGKYGFIDKTGKFVIEPKFDDVNYFKDGLCHVKIDDKYGFIDKTGKIIIEPKFDYADDFKDGLCSVELDGKGGFIDKTGKIIIEPKFDDDDGFENGLCKVKLDGKYGVIDNTGKFVIEPKFDSLYDFKDGLCKVGIDGKYGVIDNTGKFVIEPKFDRLDNFKNGLWSVRIDGKYGVIDETGNMVIEPKFDKVSFFVDGLCRVGIDGKYGFIDGAGKIVIEPQFDVAGSFGEGLSCVKLDGKYGFIDKTGKIVIEPKFDNVDDFKDGLCKVKLDGKYGSIDKTGKFIIEPKFDNVDDFYDGFCEVVLDGKHGLIDNTGKIILEPKYDDVKVMQDGLFAVKDVVNE